MSPAHTPTPWRVGADLTGICVERRDEHGNSTPEAYTRNGWAKTVAKVTHGSWAPVNEHVANARFIVHAVNCHDEMLAALTLARTFMVDFEGLPETEADNPLRVVDAALAKTREIGK